MNPDMGQDAQHSGFHLPRLLPEARVHWRTRLARVAYAASNQLAIYLPAILMAALALGTYWLVRITPAVLPPEPERAATHTPDYFMRNFYIRSFGAQGELKSEITGIRVRHYQDTDVLDIDQPRIRSFDSAGRLVIATAQRALSNGDGSEVQLLGDAVVVREASTDKAGRLQPRTELRGEFLHVLQNTEKLRSHKPVTLIRGDDRFAADSLDYDNLERVIQLNGRVRATVAARPR